MSGNEAAGAEGPAGIGGRRRGLGRGLGALISRTDGTDSQASAELVAQAEAGGIRLLEISQIRPNPHQPRALFAQAALEELAASIRAHGLLQPLIVTRDQAAADGYRLVAGERRWRAAQLAGLQELPAIVREATPQQLLEWALVENLQRADLNPLEEAAAYQTLMAEFELTQAQVAERVGKSRSAVANAVRLLQLPLSVQEALTVGQISAGHARALLALGEAAEMERVLALITARGLNVRQAEALVRELLEEQLTAVPVPPAHPAAEIQMRVLEDSFRSALSTRVNLTRNPDGSGRLVIHFYSDGDLDSLYRVIVGDETEEP